MLSMFTLQLWQGLFHLTGVLDKQAEQFGEIISIVETLSNEVKRLSDAESAATPHAELPEARLTTAPRAGRVSSVLAVIKTLFSH
jgi:hypothetical protein